ncbi:aminoglycoside phosphotransferase family protein [uncultured Thiodictyon sp.]|uniref:phosphotransferase enzyme family protein n=1 Tax=uncultured Thiodictyon sp. TaxID=1846217 RepID=UPI0025E8576C|nr:aminoglycoside phosphotransferase family protein [uncultured Thiodictyon sp.]
MSETPNPIPPDLKAIVAGFAVGAPQGTIAPLGRGLINDTFAVTTAAGCYVLQRVNQQVFPDPERIMANLALLAAHAAGRAGLRVPALIPARDGRTFLRTPAGDLWRLMELIPDAVTLDRLGSVEQARQVGLALGRFHRLTRDLEPTRLGFTLPGFHRTPDYLARHLDLRAALTPRDAAESACMAFIDERVGMVGVLEQALAGGLIPLRITHGDPKIDNILFHEAAGHALALIDLDTVQPGLIQHDLGDCLRSCCNRQGESGEGWRVRFDLEFCAPIVSAYADETRDFLASAEVEMLYDGIRLMPFELGLRFLNDHLDGDRYFRVTHRGQNLHKATVQFALVADIEARESDIRTLIDRAYCRAG